MKTEQMQHIFDKICEYDKIVIFRHLRPDGDAVGSTMGLREILRLTYPEKDIRLVNCDFSDYVRFLGEEDTPLPDDYMQDALGIVLDTATAERISNPQYALCRELCKIDHHIDIKPYGDLTWIEDHRSSTCEMIVAFYDAFRDTLKINREAATYLYTGMVTDSGRFRFRSVSGDTMRLAAMLLDEGVDLDHLYAHLYMKDYHTLKFQSYAYEHMKMTENAVVYLYITRAAMEKFGLTFEEASASVSYMDSIKNSLIWLAFIETETNDIRVRLRSRFVTINKLAEKYHGGGHDCASGATVTSRREMRELIADADALLADYKANHEGWL
ncbi:MAG: bifunctional oligoribonuclease/PAP phosphatase NrnA [Clostridia bacterium]|nr:bifunctional oligoribonuclease/PAP phosphatase NrnA [Clostridia bacterium]